MRLAPSSRPAALLAALLAVTAARGAAGEREPEKLDERRIGQLEREVAKYSTCAVVEVLSAGKVKVDENQPQMPRDPFGRAMRFSGMAQQARCRVTEVVRGRKDAGEIPVLVRHFDQHKARRRLQGAGERNPTEEKLWAEAGMRKGQTYLVILAVDENIPPGKEQKGPGYTTVRLPLYGPHKDALAAARKMAKRISEYDNPSKPTEKQLAKAAGHIKALASPKYEARSKAHEALVAIGPAISKLLQKTREETKDLETRLRCGKVLEDIKPLAGGHPDDWAGEFVVKKVEPVKEEEDGEEGKKPVPAVRAVVQQEADVN